MLALSLVAYFRDDIEDKYSALGIVLVTSTVCEVIIARPCAKCFAWIILFNGHNTMKQAVIPILHLEK